MNSSVLRLTSSRAAVEYSMYRVDNASRNSMARSGRMSLIWSLRMLVWPTPLTDRPPRYWPMIWLSLRTWNRCPCAMACSMVPRLSDARRMMSLKSLVWMSS